MRDFREAVGVPPRAFEPLMPVTLGLYRHVMPGGKP